MQSTLSTLVDLQKKATDQKNMVNWAGSDLQKAIQEHLKKVQEMRHKQEYLMN